MKLNLDSTPFEKLGTAIGVGLLAGLAGTVAITLAQMVEMKLTKRPPSTAPVDAVSKVLDVKPTEESQKQKVSQEIHWVYGTAWGVARGLFSLAGLRGWPATAAHFAAVWGTALIMLPSLKVAQPIQKEDAKTISTDALLHAVYATAAGLAFDAIEHDEMVT